MLKRMVLLSFSCFVLFAAIFCMSLNSYAASRVISSKQPWCSKCKLNVFHATGKCSGGGQIGMDPVHYNLFRRGNDVYAKGTGFTPLSTIKIYVVPDQDWVFDDIIPADESSNGVEVVKIGALGVLPCKKIWGRPLDSGDYDIVVDANQDGTFNSGDAVDGETGEIGFRVIP